MSKKIGVMVKQFKERLNLIDGDYITKSERTATTLAWKLPQISNGIMTNNYVQLNIDFLKAHGSDFGHCKSAFCSQIVLTNNIKKQY